MYTLEHKPERKGYFRIEWLYYLVNEYGFSAEWLITGNGDKMKKAHSIRIE